MLLRGKLLELVDESDLQALVSNEVAERKTIEYKSELPKYSDNGKKEFLADVSSFANASGGHLIYGIKEEEGVAKEVVGLEITNSIDSVILRLNDIIRDGIAPRITGIKIQQIKLQNSKFVLIIEVPKSWAMPHMIIFQNHSRFFSRHSNGKNLLDVGEIRAAFALSESIAEKMRNFRIERLSKIVSGETPVPLKEAPKIILHIVPFNTFDSSYNINLSSFQGRDFEQKFRLLKNHSWDHRYNFDGILYYSPSDEDRASNSYTQFFRNGSIEAIAAFDNDKNLIPSDYEIEVTETIPSYIQLLREIRVELPLIIMLSLVGVKGLRMSQNGLRINRHIVDRDVLIIPEVLVEEFDCNPTDIMKPIFDAVWNSAGMQYSLNYDIDGKWTGGK